MEKTLKFRSNLAEQIIKGEKTATWRLFDEKDLQAGDRVWLVSWETGDKFGEAEITNVREKMLGEVSDEDYEGHERYESSDAMIENYRKFYGDKVDKNTTAKIIKFKLIK